MTSAEQLLWRYEYGGGAPEVLSESLHTIIDDLENGQWDQPEARATIRLWRSDLLQARTDALQLSRRFTHLGQFRDAVRQIRVCERSTREVRLLLDAIAATDRAEEAMLMVHDLAGTARLRHLPTPVSLAQIVDTARQAINERRSLTAARMASTCERLAHAFRQPANLTAADRKAAMARIAEIERLCRSTAAFAAAADDVLGDGTIATLQQLLEDEWARLGFRLLTELEIELAGRRRFYLHYERSRAGTVLTFGAPEEVRAVVREMSWDGAVEHYWRRSLSRYQEAVERQTRRIDDLLRLFNENLPPPSGESEI